MTLRVLKFIVNKQDIKQDPKCDFDGLVPGTEGYLRAEFKFSKEWDGCVKAVGFYSRLGREFEPQLLDTNDGCLIPSEALKGRVFSLKVIGKKGDLKLTSNKIIIYQKA